MQLFTCCERDRFLLAEVLCATVPTTSRRPAPDPHAADPDPRARILLATEGCPPRRRCSSLRRCRFPRSICYCSLAAASPAPLLRRRWSTAHAAAPSMLVALGPSLIRARTAAPRLAAGRRRSRSALARARSGKEGRLGMGERTGAGRPLNGSVRGSPGAEIRLSWVCVGLDSGLGWLGVE
jgi:hypothetical protein